jgi:hypothetical protein
MNDMAWRVTSESRFNYRRRILALSRVGEKSPGWREVLAHLLPLYPAVGYCDRMNAQPVEQGTSDAQGSGIGGHTHSSRILRAIFGRHLMDMAILMMIAVVFSGLRQPEHVLGDPDIWWHLADARILCSTHHFIQVEPYSFTVAGQRWVNPEWLSELPYWFGYKLFGLVGIWLITWLGLSANILFIYWRSRFKSHNAGLALWMAGLAFVLMWVNSGARTILIAYLALSAEMAILEAVERGRARLLWLLPPLFCVWINLHGSWIIGIALFALYILCGLRRADVGIFHQESFSCEERNRRLAVLGASLIALMVNPYGWRLIWNPFDMAMNQTLNIANVLEWQPLNLSGGFVGKAALAAIGLTVLANAVHSRKWKIFELAIVFFAWYAAFDHARFTFLAAILTIPMLAGDLTRSFFPVSDQKTIPVMNGLIAAGALCVVAWYFPTQGELQKGMAANFPLQSIASVQSSWRTLNQEHLGGIMDFDSKPTFIDTRWDTFEHHGIVKDFLDILHSHDSISLLDKYRIDHVLLRQEEPLTYLLERTPGWTVLNTEGTGHDQYELFARTPARDSGSSTCPAQAQSHPLHSILLERIF